MKLSTMIAQAVFMFLIAAGVQTQRLSIPKQDGSGSQTVSHDRQHVEHLSTPAILEPDGYTAACFATNADNVNRVIVAGIFDWRGDNVNETSACDVPRGPGIRANQRLTTAMVPPCIAWSAPVEGRQICADQ